MTKITVADLHIHTNYSFDSNATMQEYCQAALERGVDILCFTDHIECNPTFNTLTDFQFARRAENFHKVKQQYPELTLLSVMKVRAVLPYRTTVVVSKRTTLLRHF